MKKIIHKALVLFFMFLVCASSIKAEVKWNYIKSPKYKSELISEYNKIPSKARDLYESNNLEIIVYGYNYYSKYAGLFDGKVHIESYKQNWLKSFYNRKGIFKSKSVKYLSINYAKMALIHELGHAYDYNNGWISKDSEFSNIYKSERIKFTKTKYYKTTMAKVKANISNNQEYFASSFSLFVRNPNDLKKYCPKTYNYFMEELY